MVNNFALHLLHVTLLVLELEATQNCSQDNSTSNNINSNCNVVRNFTDCGIRGNSLQSPFSCGLERIVGGCPAQPGELPWLCALLHRNEFRCGATLLYTNPAIVLTAAHCVRDGHKHLDPSSLLLLCGVYNLTSSLTFHDTGHTPSSLDILEVVVHPKYNHVDNQNDIALIKAEDKNIFLDKNWVYPICFPSKDETYEGWNKSFAAGWGANSTTGPHTVGPPRKVQLMPESDENCSRAMDAGIDRIKPGMMCAGGQQGKDSCQGDSGGPLMSSADGITWSLTGIVSFGNQCGIEGEYGVYTRVSDYFDWIESSFQNNRDNDDSNPSISVVDLLDDNDYDQSNKNETSDGLPGENNNQMNDVNNYHMDNVTGDYMDNVNTTHMDNVTSNQMNNATNGHILNATIIHVDNDTNEYMDNDSSCESCNSVLCDFQCGNDSFLSITIGAGASAVLILVIILIIVCPKGNRDQKEPQLFHQHGSPFSTSLSNTLSLEMKRKSSRMTKQSSFESTSRRKDDFMAPDYPLDAPYIGDMPRSTFTSFSSTSMDRGSIRGSTLGSVTHTGKRSIPSSFVSSRVSPTTSQRTYQSIASKTSQFDTPRSKISQFDTSRSKTSQFGSPRMMHHGIGITNNNLNENRVRSIIDNYSEGSLTTRVLPGSGSSSLISEWKLGSIPGTGDSKRKKMKVVPIPGQERVDIVLRDRTSKDSEDMDRESKSAEADMDIGGKFEGMLEREKMERTQQENIYEEPIDSLLSTSH